MKLTLGNILLALLVSGLFAGSIHAERAYWQQDVSYQMEVRLDSDGRTLVGHLIFGYRNNSPDTLNELRFHAHYNSFSPGTPMDRRRKSLGDNRIGKASPKDFGSLVVDNLQDDQDRSIEPDFDYSIFTVPLHEPLMPGEAIGLMMDFRSYIPGSNIAYRSSARRGQLKVAHWYPQVCVYDHKMGWVDNQYLGRGEAYGEFGTYDVNITLPEPFIVGGTGVLINRDVMLPDGLLQLIALSNFADWPWGKQPEETFGDSNRLKTWRFHAENVNDFAWVADPQFRIGYTRSGDTDIWVLARQDHASGWQDAAEVTRQGIEVMEREVGPFPYPEFTVVDCFSGMEYPGIVFCGGKTPTYKLLIWHEMAHNYFMGALGSNQTDRPFLDEGFTTYMEIRIMEEVIGYQNLPRDRWGAWNVVEIDRWYRGLRPYLQWQKSGYAKPLHIQSDLTDPWYQYRVSAYYKPASMLFALQDLIGEEGMRRVLRAYYKLWRFRHPYEHAFFRSAEETLGTSLEWFYEAWVRGTKNLDYSIKKVRSKLPGKTALRIRREGDMILPVKVRVEDSLGDAKTYFIPLDREPTPPDCDVRLPRWNQMRDPHRDYIFELDEASAQFAELDPQGLLADVDPLNNTTSMFGAVHTEFDFPLQHISPVNAYRLRWSPTAFYNGVDGLQIGAYGKGDYLNEWAKTDLALRVGALTGRVSAEISYDNDFRPLGRGTTWGLSTYTHEGHRGGEVRLLHVQKTGFDQPIQWRTGLRWTMHEMFDEVYLPDPSVWEEGLLSAICLEGAFYPRVGRLHFAASAAVESDALFSDFGYTRASAEVSALQSLSRIFNLSLRGFLGSASAGTPVQCWYGLGGGGPLLSSRSKWLRAWASLPPDWDVRSIGDGNLSGYSSYSYLARNVISLQTKLTGRMKFLEAFFEPMNLPSRFKLRIDGSIFAGVGDLAHDLDGLALENQRSEAGFGLSFRLPSGSGISLDFPVYVSEPAAGKEEWAWRTVLGFFLKKN